MESSSPRLDGSRLSPPLPWLLGLWFLALILALIGLGGVPLRDWDESIVARVALEISRRPWPSHLLPTYLGSSYLNKPPGLHFGIAAAIGLWRWLSAAGSQALPPEWVVRLIPALGSTLLVPLLALVQAQLRPRRPDIAVATAVITLTLLPLARHGRLAMLDGTQLTAMAIVWLGVLMAAPGQRRALAGGWLAGLGASLLLLLKAPVAMPVLGGALLLRFLDHELNRRAWGWLLVGMLAGLMPGLLWHGWNLAVRGQDALVMWGAQGMARILETVNGNGGGPLVPLTQLLVGGWPWLPLLPFALIGTWRERRQRAGRWCLGLLLLAALLVFPLRTQLPWYSLLLWPPFALTCGPLLADLAAGSGRLRLAFGLGRFWAGLGGLLLGACAVVIWLPGRPLPLNAAATALPAGLGLLLGGSLLASRRARPLHGLLTVAVGWFLSLALLFAGPLWNWELGEQPSITAALQVAGKRTGPTPIFLLEGDGQMQRPSLHWYLDPPVAPLGEQTGRWPRHRFQLLVRAGHEGSAEKARCRLEEAGPDGWQRWRCPDRTGGS